jgi:hypothetical protein
MPSRYIRITEREFELIRNEIYSAESASGGMDEEVWMKMLHMKLEWLLKLFCRQRSVTTLSRYSFE